MNALKLSLTAADTRLLLLLVRCRRPRVDVLMRCLTRLGNWYVIMPLTVALGSGVVPGLTAAGRAALWTLVVSHGLVQALKRTVGRERPELPVGLSFIVEPEDRFSFPSGHATAGLAVALPVALALPPLPGLGVVVLGILVGVSRCYLGVHYPGDVLVGWGLAATVLMLRAVLPFAF